MKHIFAHSMIPHCHIKDDTIHPYIEMNLIINDDTPDFDEINGEIAVISKKEKISFCILMNFRTILLILSSLYSQKLVNIVLGSLSHTSILVNSRNRMHLQNPNSTSKMLFLVMWEQL